MQPVISVIGLPGVPTRSIAEALSKLTDKYRFEHVTSMREALMIASGLWHGNLDDVMQKMLDAEEAPLFHLYIELPQATCLKSLVRRGFDRSEYFKAKPVFDEWAKVGEMVGQVFTVNPIKEGISDPELAHMIDLFAVKLMDDHKAFLASKHDESEDEEVVAED